MTRLERITSDTMEIYKTVRPLACALRAGNIGVAFFDPIYGDIDVATSLFNEFDESRFVATPHIASLTADAREAMGRKAVQ